MRSEPQCRHSESTAPSQEKGVTQYDALLSYELMPDNDDNKGYYTIEEKHLPCSHTTIIHSRKRETPSAQDDLRKLTANEFQDPEMNFLPCDVQCMKGFVAEHSTHMARI